MQLTTNTKRKGRDLIKLTLKSLERQQAQHTKSVLTREEEMQ